MSLGKSGGVYEGLRSESKNSRVGSIKQRPQLPLYPKPNFFFVMNFASEVLHVVHASRQVWKNSVWQKSITENMHKLNCLDYKQTRY